MATPVQRQILVVDDNGDVRRLLQKILTKAGFAVVEAAGGREALVAVEAGIPDLVLMDLRLPGDMDGFEITRLLREDTRMARVPIVALTASVLPADRDRAMAAGCSGFIGKPVDIAELPRRVETFMENYPGG